MASKDIVDRSVPETLGQLKISEVVYQWLLSRKPDVLPSDVASCHHVEQQLLVLVMLLKAVVQVIVARDHVFIHLVYIEERLEAKAVVRADLTATLFGFLEALNV